MKRYLLAILFTFSVCLYSDAQSLLWKISGNGLSKPSYLYGTMHVQDERAFRLNDSVLVAFDRCDAVVNEMDLDSIDPFKLLSDMMLDSGKTLHDFMTEKEFNKVSKKLMKASGFSLEMFKTMQPIMIVSMMSESQFDAQMAVALDMFFQERGKEQNKKLLGLETYEEQLNALLNIPIEEQVKMLTEKMPSEKKSKTMIDRMIELYNTAALEELYDWSMDDETGDRFEASLLTERNFLMADRIVPIISDQSSFIALGALHLPGEVGVINLLRQKGFIVEPVGGIAKNSPMIGLPGSDKSDSSSK